MAPSGSSEGRKYSSKSKGSSQAVEDEHNDSEGYHEYSLNDIRPPGEVVFDDENDPNDDRDSSESHLPPSNEQRRPQTRSYNSTANQPTPKIIYAKGILSTSGVMDRGGGSGQPGDRVNPSPKATSQYQQYPSANSNSYNGNGPPQPPLSNHPYNNGPPPRHNYPPYHHYPQSHYPPTYYDPHGQFVNVNDTSNEGINVRGEEVGIVIVVLLLWVGAIILFFNRWGKIRMLEPYQPKFCENHRPSCPMADVTAISNHPLCSERSFSKFNISTEMLASPHFVKCNYHGIPASDPTPGFSGYNGGLIIPGFATGGSTGMLSNHRNSIMSNHHHRPRQNSVFVTSPSSQVSSFYGSDTTLQNASRKTKSAVDLPTLVLTGEFIDNARRNSKNSITQL